MLLQTEWNWGAFTAFFWAGVNAVLIAWCWFRLPEPKDRTYAELDVLFEHKVRARDFENSRVNQVAGGQVDVVRDDKEGVVLEENKL